MKKLLLLLMPLLLFANHHISLQLEWKHQFEFAGFYAAIEKGYYKDVGLSVSLKEYQDKLDVSQDVLQGKVDFGISSSSLILEKLKGENVVLVASYFKQNVLALVTQKNIKTIAELKNKKIMALPFEMQETSLGVMLQKNGIQRSDYTLIPQDYTVDKFLTKEVDAMSIFLSNQLYALQKAGAKYNILNPASYGVYSYDLELFTSKKYMQNHPREVNAFVEATKKGWEYAFAHKKEIVALIYTKYSQKKSKDALMYEARATEKLFKTESFQIGAVIPELIVLNAQMYQSNITSDAIQKLLNSYTMLSTQKYFVHADLHANTLTPQEKEYLTKKKITMCIDPAWMPFESFHDGKYVGMSADYFELINKNLGTEIEIIPTKRWEQSLLYAKERKCDLLSLVMKTDARAKYLNFTSPYLSIPVVLATNEKASFVTDFSTLTKEQKLAIPKGYAFAEIIHERYPNIQLVYVQNTHEGLERVRTNKVFGYVGSLATVGYWFQKHYIGELKISGKFNYNWELGIGVRNDDTTLLHILQKAVSSIRPEQKQKILNKWVAIQVERGMDYQFAMQVVLGALLVLLIALYWNRKLSKLNKKLQIAKDKSEEMRQAKANFLANMSHEIRTPMNSILGTIYLLKETSLNEIQKKYSLQIEQSTNNLLYLINDILDFSKLEAKKLTLSKNSFSLLSLLDALNNMFNQKVYEKSLDFQIISASNVPENLYGDNLKLKQILINLLANAIKFTEEGSVKLYIEVPLEGLFRFSVIDTGIGIEASQSETIFTSFTQTDSDTTRKYSGSGLGLAISKELVLLMGGKIWVHSVLGEGSTFIFEVPLKEAKEEPKVLPKKGASMQQQRDTPREKSDAQLQVLYKKLKEATQKRRPQLCTPIIEEIQAYQLSEKEAARFEKVKLLVKKYKFAQAGELL